MIRHSAFRTAMLVVFGGLIAGCSETGFQDFMGAGKYAPDETQVSAGQPLSVPPDLQLRPPSATEPPQVASRPAADQPPAGQLHQPQDLAAAPQPDESWQQAARQPASQQAAQPQQLQQQTAAAETPDDVYARWGVSRHHPDGRQKSQVELNEEMRQKRIERERQQDPNYGTIWNLNSIWSDG
jgi:hypothetical protein